MQRSPWQLKDKIWSTFVLKFSSNALSSITMFLIHTLEKILFYKMVQLILSYCDQKHMS